ncbi:MAG: phosphate acyltransferase PlsX [Porticoccaceae bacterium]|nr:phosphate acyltransferase PlsX [Porticoccaceae bacterium]MDG1474399.1 phosphate acyltransferase PlsX [Porticoccaceae bacterium]
MTRIAVDAMGGESGPGVTVPALLNCLGKHQSVEAILYGDLQKVAPYLSLCNDQALLSRVKIIHCEGEVLDTDKPSDVIRAKTNSSMSLAVSAVAKKYADACISAGNTGALMGLGLIKLRTLPGISRPAICTTLPTVSGRSYVLDLGANVECSPEQLHQFSVLGSLTAYLLDDIKQPSVRLLNVGVEEGKGSNQLQRTAHLLSADPQVNYCGFVEGNGIFKGLANVVVCDGFAGNIALKATEGFAMMIATILEDLLRNSWLARVTLGVMSRSFEDLKDRLDPALYNGAYLLGLHGIVIKSHGSASKKAFENALEVAIEAARHNLPKALAPLLTDKFITNNKESV